MGSHSALNPLPVPSGGGVGHLTLGERFHGNITYLPVTIQSCVFTFATTMRLLECTVSLISNVYTKSKQ